MLLVDFEDKLLNVTARLSHENTFQIFDLIQNSQQILYNLEELRLQFIGGYQSWVQYQPDPFSRNFKTWKGCHKKLKNLKKLSINLSESRLEDCMDIFFQGFEDLGELQLEELELDFFSILMNTEQLIQVLQKIAQIPSLTKFSLNLGKLNRVRATPDLMNAFQELFSKLTELESLQLNLSSLFQVQELPLIEMLLEGIKSIPQLSSLKLSLKNCRLNSQSIPHLKSLLDQCSSNMQHLDLDISYNPSLGEDMTNNLYESLKKFKQLNSFSINLKGSDSNFKMDDYFLIQKFIYKIFKLSIQRYKSTQAIQHCQIKNISIQLPLTFIRQNLSLYTQNNALIQNMIKYGPLLYKKHTSSSQLTNSFRKDIINEMFCEFLV